MDINQLQILPSQVVFNLVSNYKIAQIQLPQKLQTTNQLLVALSKSTQTKNIIRQYIQTQTQLNKYVLKYIYKLNNNSYQTYMHILPLKYTYQLMREQIQSKGTNNNLYQFISQTIIPKFIQSPTQEGFNIIKLYLQTISIHNIHKITNIREKYIQLFLNNKQVQYKYILMKTLQLIHIAQPKFSLSTIIHTIKPYLYKCLCDYDTKGANALAINIYGSILKDIQQYNQYVQAFIDIYSTLDNYGTHLIKDVWHKFYYLCAQAKHQQQVVFTCADLIHCILHKVQQHSNNNITKYCIQSLLTNKQSYTLFEQVGDSVYGSLIQTLNSGAHYHDCTLFHNDSKMYEYIRQFHLSYYNRISSKQLGVQLKRLVNAIHKYATFQHCLVAYMGIFYQLKHQQCRCIDKQGILKLLYVFNKYYKRFAVRKRIALIKYLFHIVNTYSIQAIQLQWLVTQFICKLPIQVLTLYHQYQFIHQYPLPNIIHTLTTLEHNQHKIVLQYIVNNQHIPIQPTQSYTYTLMNELLPSLTDSFYISHNQYTQTIANINYIHHIQNNLQYRISAQIVQNILYVISYIVPKEEVQLDIVQGCIQYAVKRGIRVSSNENKQSKALTKFIQYIVSNIQQQQQTQQQQQQKRISQQMWTNILIVTLKYKHMYTTQYRAIQEVLYNTYHNHQQIIKSAKQSLRVRVLLFCILSHDPNFLKTQTQMQQNIRDIYQCYDFEHYEQLYQFISIITNNKHRQVDYDGTCNIMLQIIQNMLHSLDYGIHKKEVVSCSNCIVQVMFGSHFHKSTCQLYIKLLQIGERYWGFQRQLIFTTIYKLSTHKHKLNEHSHFINVLIRILCIQEYRGQDSAILLHQHNQHHIYQQALLHKQSDYDGTTLRFAVIEWAQKIITNIDQHEQLVQFFIQVFDRCLQICNTQHTKQKMFLTGTHKTKLMLWQFMLTMPQFVVRYHPQCNKIVNMCISMMSHNNILQVRHYAQIWMMRVLYIGKQVLEYDSICELVSNKLKEIVGQSSLGRNISYMVVGGLLLQMNYHHNLYMTLITFICSHIGYFRGLSQYFCFSMGHHQQDKYISILYEQFKKDVDAIKLTQILHQILTQYTLLCKQWNVYEHLIKEKPTLNGQVVCDNYYIQQLKRIGQKLVKQSKNEDGFILYRDIWKKLVNHQNKEQMEQYKETNNTTFQRKIDPSLDNLYSFQLHQQKGNIHNNRVSKLRILVISHDKLALYGHLARVGQILGIQSLCIPSCKILQTDDFKNVSCTAQKWLQISQHNYLTEPIHEKKNQNSKNKNKKEKEKGKGKGQSNNKEKLIRILNLCKHQGYQFYKVIKSPKSTSADKIKMDRKCLLIIDQAQSLQLNNYKVMGVCNGEYYSTHVQATIFIWEYFKTYLISSSQ